MGRYLPESRFDMSDTFIKFPTICEATEVGEMVGNKVTVVPSGFRLAWHGVCFHSGENIIQN